MTMSGDLLGTLRYMSPEQALAKRVVIKAFGEDLQRFLGNEPIKARRPTLLDRARKWTTRHQGVTWTAALTLLIITLGSSLSVGFIARANRQLAKANTELTARTALAEKRRVEALDAKEKAEVEKARATRQHAPRRQEDCLGRSRSYGEDLEHDTDS